jgi:hypothetical protein
MWRGSGIREPDSEISESEYGLGLGWGFGFGGTGGVIEGETGRSKLRMCEGLEAGDGKLGGLVLMVDG